MTRGLFRRALASAMLPALLPGCASPLPALEVPGTTPAARALLEESAAAHGLPALARLRDISVSYEGEWPALIGRLQPALVDSGFRGGSEERLLLRDRVVAQAHTGQAGRKQVVRQAAPGASAPLRVWLNGEEAEDTERRAAAALVADGYALFLLGPMLLAGPWSAGRSLDLGEGGTERITQDGRAIDCDVLRARIAPGLGVSRADELALFIGRRDRLMRRIRFSLEGLDSTRGAVAEVDCLDHRPAYGVLWPTRFHEHLLRPFPLPVHNWRLRGLDVDRGFSAAEISGASFTGRAAAPAGNPSA